MKKFLKIIMFLTLSTFSFAKWEVDRDYNTLLLIFISLS